MENKYYITEEQFKEIEHYRDMFELNAERIQSLCKTERDDIVYGFELGITHTMLRENVIGMLELESEIKSQNKIKQYD